MAFDPISALIGIGTNAYNSTVAYDDARKKQGEYDDFLENKQRMLDKYKTLFSDALSGKATDADLLALQQMKNLSSNEAVASSNRLNQIASRAGVSTTPTRGGGMVGSAQGNIQKALNEIYGAQDANLLATVQNRKDVATQNLFNLDQSYNQQEAAYEGQYNQAKSGLDSAQNTANMNAIFKGLGIMLPVTRSIYTEMSKLSGQDPTIIGQGIKTISDAVGGTIDQVLPVIQKMSTKMNATAFDQAFGKYGITSDMFNGGTSTKPEYVGNATVGYSEPVYETKVNPITGEKEKVLTGYKKIAGTSAAELEAIKNYNPTADSSGVKAFKALPIPTQNKLVRNAKELLRKTALSQGKTLDKDTLELLAVKYVYDQLEGI